MLSLASKILDTTVVSVVTAGSTGLLIGTHDGSFHCDEALACGMLKLLPKYKDATIVRTRNLDILSQCHIVVDVGATYDPVTNRYDHHQREFTGVQDNYNTKLSSAGLVYKHFGRDILKEVFISETISEFDYEKCYQRLYAKFIEHIDAIDNGVSVSDGQIKYDVSSTLSRRVGFLNPSWNEEQSSAIMNERFISAMHLTCTEFLTHSNQIVKSWLPARSIVEKAIQNRAHIHGSGKILIFDQACPWKDHLFEIEKELSCEPIFYALYQDMGGSWRIQAVPVDETSFNSRKKLPSVWCGLRDDILSEKVSNYYI
jgi:uncharacterized UPF0160 family protein